MSAATTLFGISVALMTLSMILMSVEQGNCDGNVGPISPPMLPVKCECKYANDCHCEGAENDGLYYAVNLTYVKTSRVWPLKDSYEIQISVSEQNTSYALEIGSANYGQKKPLPRPLKLTNSQFDLKAGLKGQQACESSNAATIWNPISWFSGSRVHYRCFRLAQTGGSLQERNIKGEIHLEVFDNKDKQVRGPIALYSFQLHLGD